MVLDKGWEEILTRAGIGTASEVRPEQRCGLSQLGGDPCLGKGCVDVRIDGLGVAADRRQRRSDTGVGWTEASLHEEAGSGRGGSQVAGLAHNGVDPELTAVGHHDGTVVAAACRLQWLGVQPLPLPAAVAPGDGLGPETVR